mmetsp:Transcript_13900/g.38106  ORF Transcript_13900/g.38106 Transcript_13900/m.38106 type:complete len:230 (+) Transcript_13900:216-905(+)
MNRLRSGDSDADVMSLTATDPPRVGLTMGQSSVLIISSVSVSKKWTCVPAVKVATPPSTDSCSDVISFCTSYCLICDRDLRSHTRSTLSSPPLTSLVPHGRKSALLTPAVWPSISVMDWVLSVSKILSFLNLPPHMSSLVSGEKSTLLTMWEHWKLCSSSPVSASHSRAVKSADPVAARRAGVSRRADHTAPLCPSKVPIQSPVSPRRIIGLESKHAEIRNKPSGVTLL